MANIKFTDDVKEFLLLTHARNEIKLMEAITLRMYAHHDWVDLRGRVLQSYLIDMPERSIYLGLRKLVNKKELIRVSVSGATEKGDTFRFYVGLLDYAKILDNHYKKYEFIPVNNSVIKKFKDYQNKVLKIIHNSKLLGTKTNEGVIENVEVEK